MLPSNRFASAVLASISLTGTAAAQEFFTPGHVFVSCNYGKIYEFDPGGNFIRSIHTMAAGALGGIAFGPDGNLYVTQRPSGALMRVTPNGAVTATDVHLVGHPDDLAPNGKDGLVVASWEYGRITDLPFAGTSQPKLGTTITPDYGIPGSIEVAPDGTWFVTAYAQGTKPAGLKRTLAANTKAIESLQFPNPTSVLLGGERSLVANLGVGVYLAEFGKAPVLLDLPYSNKVYDLARIADGTILVTCPDLDHVMRFNDDGDYLGIWTQPGMDYPYRIAVAPQVFEFNVSGQFVAELEGSDPAGKIKINEGRLVVAAHSGTMFLVVPVNGLFNPAFDSMGPNIISLRPEVARDGLGSMMLRGCTRYRKNDVATSVSVELAMNGILPSDKAALAKSIKGTMHLTIDRPEGTTNAMLKFKGKRLAED